VYGSLTHAPGLAIVGVRSEEGVYLPAVGNHEPGGSMDAADETPGLPFLSGQP
jgi:hypothetical protein